MKASARAPRRSDTHEGEEATTTSATADLDEQVQKRQLEKSVSWTGRERLRFLWYRLRLTVREMNYATRRLIELQTRLPLPPPRHGHHRPAHRSEATPATCSPS